MTSATISYFSVGTIVDKCLGDTATEKMVKYTSGLIFNTGTNLKAFCISTILDSYEFNNQKSECRMNKYQRGKREVRKYGRTFNR